MRVKVNGTVNEANTIKSFVQHFVSIDGNVKTLTAYTNDVKEANGLLFMFFGRNIVVGGVDAKFIQEVLSKVCVDGYLDLDSYNLPIVEKKRDIKEGEAYLLYDSVLFEDGKVEAFNRQPLGACGINSAELWDDDDEEE